MLWRTERPDEWKMDEFVRQAEILEKTFNNAYESEKITKQESIQIIRDIVGDYLTVSQPQLTSTDVKIVKALINELDNLFN